MDSNCYHCKYYFNNMCKGEDKTCSIFKRVDGKKTNIIEFLRWYFRGSSLKPRNKREWFKFGFDIFLMLFFVFMIINTVYFYNDGWNAGYQSCQNQFMANLSSTLKELNMTGLLP